MFFDSVSTSVEVVLQPAVTDVVLNTHLSCFTFQTESISLHFMKVANMGLTLTVTLYSVIESDIMSSCRVISGSSSVSSACFLPIHQWTFNNSRMGLFIGCNTHGGGRAVMFRRRPTEVSADSRHTDPSLGSPTPSSASH